MKEKKKRYGGTFRALFRSKRNIEAANRAQNEITLFENEVNRSMGEPSEAFFPAAERITYFVIFPEGEIIAVSAIRHELQKYFRKKD